MSSGEKLNILSLDANQAKKFYIQVNSMRKEYLKKLYSREYKTNYYKL